MRRVRALARLAHAVGHGLHGLAIVLFAFPALGADPNVVAFDETTGLTVWTAHVTTGGDGIRGTPVIDSASRRLFVVTGGNPGNKSFASSDISVRT